MQSSQKCTSAILTMIQQKPFQTTQLYYIIIHENIILDILLIFKILHINTWQFFFLLTDITIVLKGQYNFFFLFTDITTVLKGQYTFFFFKGHLFSTDNHNPMYMKQLTPKHFFYIKINSKATMYYIISIYTHE